jgi:hypothetical protein
MIALQALAFVDNNNTAPDMQVRTGDSEYMMDLIIK